METMIEEVVCITNGYGKREKIWKVCSSTAAKNCKNYIRDVVDNLDLKTNPEKPVIALSLGDPTVYGNLQPPSVAVESTSTGVQGGKSNGYGPCAGSVEAREAVAEYLSFDGVSYQAKDIILCSGCSSSLDLCITVLADPAKGHNIVVPNPGFPLYRTLSESLGVTVKSYNLLPERNWEVDLQHLEAQVDENTCAIVINNPSNPCGSVFSKAHLKKILELARLKRVPVIADEIYERLVFPGTTYVSAASLNSGVPILVCGGLAKRFLVPGWRLGWIAIHDPIGAFEPEIRHGLSCLSQKTIGSNSLVQGALSRILKETPQSFYDGLVETLHESAEVAFRAIEQINGLVPYMPEGTMYLMVKIELDSFPYFRTELEFIQKLMEEESVFCLPGQCFGISGFMRLVITIPLDLIKEACTRMEEFCDRYYT